ncbi:MAG: helix-turn-helix domain-containing protein [Desmonostoc geniculatum HA4340-LM1]|nr:helix-turn-helix domain-containing protein [Desmonostoc geniculatum HA4340-LM1]
MTQKAFKYRFYPTPEQETFCGANIRPDSLKAQGQLQKTLLGKKQKPKS